MTCSWPTTTLAISSLTRIRASRSRATMAASSFEGGRGAGVPSGFSDGSIGRAGLGSWSIRVGSGSGLQGRGGRSWSRAANGR